MKVFISWSGDVSHKIACALRDWLPTVIQSIDTWVSSEDIHKGSRWSAQLAKELDETSFGIICVVPNNVTEPWLNFEAGALSKSVKDACVIPFLVGLQPSELTDGPLAQFQAVIYEKEEVKKLVHSIAEHETTKIPLDRIKRTFEACWPALHSQLEPLLAEAAELPRATSESAEVRDDSSNFHLEEIHVKILTFLGSKMRDVNLKDLAREFGIQQQKMKYYLETLEARGYLSVSHDYVHGPSYALSQNGRAYLVANNLI